MTASVREMAGVRVMVCTDDGPALMNERDINVFVGDALGHDVQWVALPVSRVGGDFFRLSTRLAGETAQKFVNHRLHLAIIGDVSAHIAASNAFRDYVYEANRGRDIWFVPDIDALERKLGG